MRTILEPRVSGITPILCGRSPERGFQPYQPDCGRQLRGGAQKILDVNYYKNSHASLCLVLPPVGSAHSAILLLECIEHFIGSALFSNPEIQIQVCSPGRLGARRSALLAIGFYLGSDTLRRAVQELCAGRLTRPTPRTSTPTASSTAPT